MAGNFNYYKKVGAEAELYADHAGLVEMDPNDGHEIISITLSWDEMRQFASFCTYVADILEDEHVTRETA